MDTPPIHAMANEHALAIIGSGGTVVVPQTLFDDLLEFFVSSKDVAERVADEEEVGLEDSFQHHGDRGPGCPVADVDAVIDDEPHDTDGDEQDNCGDKGEPDFSRPPRGYGAGCTISDPDQGPEGE